MPNDPKWRTISRVSKQPITSVLSVYIHLLVIASNATERGRTQPNANEDIASALDLECEQVGEIINAMEGRVIENGRLTGWDKRQVAREDGAAERARAWREAKKEEKRTQPNATERKKTQDTDTDTDKEEKKAISPSATKKAPKKKPSAGITLNEFLRDCEFKGQDAITESDPVFEYAKSIGLPSGFLYLGWSAFKSKQADDKRQVDWRATFRNYVKTPDWLGVWKINREGEYYLTDAGKQLERALSGVAA